jgi:hypothetical protein
VSTFLDDIFGPITQDLLGSLGKPVTMTLAPAGGDYDPSAGSSGTGATSTVYALVEYADPLKWDAGLVQGDARQLSIAGADLASPPAAGNSFAIDGGTFTIPTARAIKPIYSGEDVALWVVLANRG